MPRGRTTRLTPEVADGIVLAVKTGAPLEVAAQSQGIPPSTFWQWMARGAGKDPEGRPATPVYVEFVERVRKAEAEIHLLTVGTIRSAITRGSWEASRAWLRMRWANHYAERTEVSGPEGKAIPLEIVGLLEGMSDADLDRILARLRAGGDPGGGEGEETEG